jgi:hypothetical protein
MGTREAHTLRGAGDLRGAQAVKIFEQVVSHGFKS